MTTNFRGAEKEKPPAFVRPITVVFFLALLAGQFSFDQVGLKNPFIVPERLFGTGITFLLVGMLYLLNRNKHTREVKFTWIIILPSIYALATGLWGAKVSDLSATIIDLLCNVLIILTTSIFLRLSPRYFINTLLLCIALAGLIFSVAGLAGADPGTRVAAFGGGPNVFSRVTTMGCIAIILLVLLRRLPKIFLVFAPVTIVATIASGSRGGILAGIIALAFLVPLARKLKAYQKITAATVLAACMFVVYQRFSDLIDQTINGRIIDLTLEQGYSSGRGALADAAIKLFIENPTFGSGLRGFEQYYGQGFTYPHNLFLQAGSEGGILGLLLLLILFVSILAYFLKSPLGIFEYGFAALAAVIFVSSMFSGDYYDTRFLWVFLLIAVNADITQPLSFDEMKEKRYQRRTAPRASTNTSSS